MRPPPAGSVDPRRRLPARGFTLVEVLLVVAIVAVLASLAVPSFVDMVDRYRLTGLADNLAGEIAFAKSEAVRRNAPVHMNFGTGSGSCYAIGETEGCTCESCNIKRVGTVAFADTYARMSIAATNPSGLGLQFSPRSGVPASPATITVSSRVSSRSIRLTVSAFGFVSTCAPGGSIQGYPPCPSSS